MKKLLFSFIALFTLCGWGIFAADIPNPSAPSYDTNFSKSLTSSKSVWNPTGDGGSTNTIEGDKTLKDNIKIILTPHTTADGGFLGVVLQNVALGVIILYLLIAGAKLVVSGSKAEDLKTAVKNLGFIALGALLIYAAGRLFGAGGIIDFNQGAGTEGLGGVAESVSDGNSSLLFQVLSLLKGAAFFFAIIMIVVTGFKVVSAADADKSKKLVRGVVNVVAALVIMKVVDFIYYIASVKDFASQAGDFILSVAKFFGYLYGAVAVLMVFYAGYSFLTDGGGGDGMKRAKNILINLLVSGLVLFGFLLILYQVFAEFTD
jgi:hypothetical protein